MIARLLSVFSGFVERLNPRERVLLGFMVIIAFAMVCFLVVLLTNRSISALQQEVDDHTLLLKQLRDNATSLRERMETTNKSVASSRAEPPALGTQLQSHATQSGMGETDLEMTPQPEEQIGSWIRKSVQVRLHRKPLGELANFWALTVNDKAQYPVAITKLNVRRRRNEEDSYDVEMIVSSYWPNTDSSPTNINGRRGARNSSGANRNKGRP